MDLNRDGNLDIAVFTNRGTFHLPGHAAQAEVEGGHGVGRATARLPMFAKYTAQDAPCGAG